MSRIAARQSQRRRVLIALSLFLTLAVTIACVLIVWRGADIRTGQPAPRAPDQGAAFPPPPSGTPSTLPTPALDGGWYKLYFTAPVYPDDRARHQGGLDAVLVALIESAKSTLDMAIYDFDSIDVAQAMARARGRGVVVRMVTDSDTLNAAKNQPVQAALAAVRAAGIEIVGDARGPLMHHKFTVVDGTWVETGSWNYTDGDTYRLNNNMIVIQSPDLAANYTSEFEKMFLLKQFGPNKNRRVPYPVLTIGDTRVENYFSPQGDVADQIARTIGTARTSIRFLAFSFTSDTIAAAMFERAKAGVTISGVFETTGSKTSYSEFRRMKDAGLPVYQDGSPWAMHHKVIIIDERIVIFGSFNFSDNANTQNDENLLIVENADLARAFQAEFERMVALAQNPPARR